MMERVTNVFCGGGGVAYTNLQSANNANATTPEKPNRSGTGSINSPVMVNNKTTMMNNGSVVRARITRGRTKTVPLASGGNGGYVAPLTWEQLMLDDHFLSRFFLYFNPSDRRALAQVSSSSIKNGQSSV